MPIAFTKTQGAGNDFIVLDLRAADASRAADLPRDPAGDWSDIARHLCDRHFGIGADGLLLVLPAGSDGSGADVRMRVINSDGSEPEMCGNGLRCFVRYLHDRGEVTGSRLAVETGAGLLHAEVLPDPRGFRVRLDMGAPALLGRETLPVAGRELDVSLVSMGNPHCVTFVSDLDAFPFTELGPLVERHPRFPQRTNAEFAQVLAPDRIRVKVWERGAGPTLACGTGACAVAVAAVERGLAERRVSVELPGGTLDIAWPETGNVFLTGPAEVVFTGQVDLSAFATAGG